MTSFAITGADVVLPQRVEKNATVVFEGDRILDVGGPAPEGAEIIDATGKLVLPGLIDIHTHGRMISLDPASIRKNLEADCAEYAKKGVARFLVTIASAPVSSWLEAMPVIEEIIQDPPAGAIPVGVHYEGIFLNQAAMGAHPIPLIKAFDKSDPDHRALFERWPDLVKMMTFAPEVPGNEDLISACGEQGIFMSLGHSIASPEQIKEFADKGVVHMTHLFNGMKGIHHRDPGPPLAGLLEDGVSVDLISDGYHLHPEIVRLIHRMKWPDRRVLITDRVTIQMPGATPGLDEDEPNRLPNGNLAGSTIGLCRAVKKYMDFTSCLLHEAAAMASLYPAQLLGMDAEAGSIEPGKFADFWIADPDLRPEAVYIRGRKFESRAG